MACLLPLALFVSHEKTHLVDRQSEAVGAGLMVLAQLAVSWWIWSVWTWRFRMATSFRGGQSESLLGEFQAYGYSKFFFKLIGFVKLSCATILAPIAIFHPCPIMTSAAAGILAVLMLGAIGSHFKVGDPLGRSLPALTMLILCSLILMGAANGCEGGITLS